MPEDIKTQEDLEKLPFLDKHSVKENFDKLISKKSFKPLRLLSAFTVGGVEKTITRFLGCKGEGVNFTVVIINDKVDESLKEELLKTGHKVYFLNKEESCKSPKYLFKLLKIIKENKIAYQDAARQVF
ncbi:hypothetical protein tpqmel_0959 [Candidatus Gastranaerophilus sp. (ex Termes propinquus)]|nr:hypothetical protein tpqmel_0959 [Candidatus Gastranaerophilus sp. (ex Termes propinquus)]